MCVQNIDVHVSCSSHGNAQLAAFFIDPRAKGSTEVVCIHLTHVRRRLVLSPSRLGGTDYSERACDTTHTFEAFLRAGGTCQSHSYRLLQRAVLLFPLRYWQGAAPQ